MNIVHEIQSAQDTGLSLHPQVSAWLVEKLKTYRNGEKWEEGCYIVVKRSSRFTKYYKLYIRYQSERKDKGFKWQHLTKGIDDFILV